MLQKTFLEIGTCDFDTCVEFANSEKWKGVMVEPTPHLAQNLRNRLNNEYNIRVVEAAVTNYDGTIDFAMAKDDTESWARGIGTVVNPNHKGTCLYDLADNAQVHYQGVYKVPCYSLDTIIRQNYAFLNHGKLDYLKLDTEGHELTILESYSWIVKPTFIKLEHKHVDDIAIRHILESQGYRVYVEPEDIYAIHTGE